MGENLNKGTREFIYERTLQYLNYALLNESSLKFKKMKGLFKTVKRT
jgi:hypothetical protein